MSTIAIQIATGKVKVTLKSHHSIHLLNTQGPTVSLEPWLPTSLEDGSSMLYSKLDAKRCGFSAPEFWNATWALHFSLNLPQLS
jgi:hypothetical protein